MQPSDEDNGVFEQPLNAWFFFFHGHRVTIDDGVTLNDVTILQT